MATTLSITNSTITIGTVNDTETLPAKTHNLSSQIANNPNKEFILNPIPVEVSLLIYLDGLLLQLSPDGVEGDYTYDHATYTLTLLVNNLETDAILLAVYQEAK